MNFPILIIQMSPLSILETSGLTFFIFISLFYDIHVSKGIAPGGTTRFISFFDEIHVSKEIVPDGTTRFAASHLGLFCLPMSHKKDARLI